MFGKKSTNGVARLIFDSPTTKYHIREIARETGISVSTVSKAVKELEAQGLVEVKEGVTKQVKGSDNQYFRDMKRVYNMKELFNSGVLDRIEEKLRPDAVVLFGSYSRGEDREDSDIDLASINGKDEDFGLERFEKEVNRTINI
ncbi:MAG: MarR family transcriptional regulator, partial [Candidatus Nanohaloarchaea archaeon]|nr:MarR family transcriptional regulator [Candidatus Nanohaloarchaea archaeon]